MTVILLYLHFILKDIHHRGMKPKERWVSGLNQQFAKLSYVSKRTGGSNPPLSASKKYGLFGVITTLDQTSFERVGVLTPNLRKAKPDFFNDDLLKRDQESNPPLTVED